MYLVHGGSKYVGLSGNSGITRGKYVAEIREEEEYARRKQGGQGRGRKGERRKGGLEDEQ